MTGYENYIGSTEPGVIQFENANEHRSYPFMDNSVLLADNGMTLPDSLITDLHLVIPKNADACLSSVYVSESMVSVCIKVSKQGTPSVMAMSCTARAADLIPYMPYRLEKLTGSEDIGGVVTFGSIDFSSSRGTYRFTENTIGIADSAISKYTPSGLRKIIDPRTGAELSGDITVSFPSYVTAENTAEGIKLGISEKANNILLSECDKDSADNPCGATPVTSINGIPPDDRKRIVLWFH